MATISEALAIAAQHHQAGRLEMAEEIYRHILAVEPNHPDALHLLGVVAHQTGRHEVAIERIEQAIRLHGTDSAFYNNLGEAYRALRRMPEAIACYGRALELKPDFVEAHYNLSIAFQEQRNLDDAVACYRRALQLKPDFAEAQNNLGNALKDQGKLDEAVGSYRRALQLEPDCAETYSNLATVLQAQGKLDEAVACYRRALELQPDLAEAYNNLGNALKDLGQLDEAIACCQRALELTPNVAEPYNNLGNALRDQGRLAEAIACYQRAIQIKPAYAEAHNNLGNAFHDQGELDEAVACYRRALQLKPDYAGAHHNLLRTLQYRGGVTLAELADANREFEQRHAAPLRSAWRVHDNVRDPNRELRLGFLSPNFGRHPVGYFLISVLESLDREQCETICYHDRIRRDDLTARFQAAASTWRDVFGRTDEQLAEQIRADRVDILFDLAGHTANNRLLVFARKPAPIQIAWIGYEGTTGLSAMDYIIADRHVIPEESEPYYREQVLRMPDGYVCLDPQIGGREVSPLPAASSGHVTYGSFNNLAKIGPQVVEVWSEILRRVPQSQLMMKYRGLGDEMVRRRYLDLFAAFGVEPHQLILLPPSSYSEYLATYDHVDIALDPFPFSGSATTCEALWMGAPVVTYPGETFASRHGLTHLTNIGLTETIARNRDEYVLLAVSLASDLTRLAEMRARLRNQMANSPLCDGKRFAENLMVLLRHAWHRWCVEGSPKT